MAEESPTKLKVGVPPRFRIEPSRGGVSVGASTRGFQKSGDDLRRSAKRVVDRSRGRRLTATVSLAIIRFAVGDDCCRSLCRFAGNWSTIHWAIERATGLGEPLTRRLSKDGVDVVMSPRSWPRVRLLPTGHTRKSDDADAVSVGGSLHTD